MSFLRPMAKPTINLATINVTHKTPSEFLQSTPTALPRSKPATPQITITLSSDMFPSFDITPEAVAYQLALYAAGQNIDSVGRNIYYELDVNNALRRSSGFSVAGSSYYTLSAFLSDVKVNDVVQAYIWTDAYNANWDYHAYQVQVSKLAHLKNQLITVMKFTTTYFSLSQGSPAVAGSYYIDVYDLDSYKIVDNVSNAKVTFMYPLEYILVTKAGGTNVDYALGSYSSTSRPYYYIQYVVNKVMMVY
jgi:hypothetical protein